MTVCRNCGASELKEMGFAGAVAPFFLKRVYDMQLEVAEAQNPLKLALRRLFSPANSLFKKLYSVAAKVELQICLKCSFVQLKQALPEGWLTRHYSDYRSDAYNRERISFEPEYTAIAAEIGMPREAKIRVPNLTKWLAGKMALPERFTMLDFGGADGRFLPEMAAEKYVFEVSDYPPVAGVVRIRSVEELKQYSYVQVSHVLEHVIEPLAFAKGVSERVEPAGYLYIEVPQELEDNVLEKLKRGEMNESFSMPIHEHINSYSVPSISALIEAMGLELVAIEKMKEDYGYITWTVVRALAQKKA